MCETWKDIPGYEGLYKVSDQGHVKSTAFRNNQTIKPREKVICPIKKANGYLYVGLSKNGSRKNHYVHRLVASAFFEHGSCCDVVNHKDHNPQNNTISNLEWCSQHENILYSAKLMRHEKSTCRQTRTGEKYITFRRGKYRVNIKKLRADRSFKSINDAIEFRLELVGW